MLIKLREARLEQNLSQKKISELVGISESYYCQLETGVRRMSLPIAKKIAVVLGRSMDVLFMPADFAKCREDDSRQADRSNLNAR
ncbi:transcriptional regulator with XRE-family HTH domain [Desulfohalotomaculum tongense]|uniref:helix-turn-helix transcriptional regulator n=1 Tax=Desulforadius tongensis TaxID=1216062 RepID=UPI00195AD589|nr:helix-turn-helix transcriptional regulator [Desulforadius tongensis]MBM7855878.1 transcriptional regulator with XRE-family HTH domain [Desulforadius tongensis]